MTDIPGSGSDPEAGLAQASGTSMGAERKMLEALVCPLTKGRLSYDAGRQVLISKAAHLAFPIRDGIPIMLVDEATDVD